MAKKSSGRRATRSGREPDSSGSRKRTMVLSLLALGAGAVGVGALTSSNNDEPSGNRIYTSREQCERDSAIPKEECGKQFTQALKAHENAAPLFPSKAACEQEHGDGKCTNPSTSTGRSSYFIPVMTGYMMGRALGGGYQAAPLYRKRADPAGRFRQMAPFPKPVPGSSSASRSTSRSAFRTRTYSTRSGSSRAYTPSRSTSRGGFGRSSRGYSGG